MVMVNNWDLKTSQNAIYRVQPDGDDPRNLYVVKDLGASLGKTNWLLPGTRNDVEGFEKEGFIKRVEGNRVTFHYQGAWREPHVAGSAAPADVRWISNLLAKLSPEQWNDAFRAGGYSEAESARYIRRLQQKIAEGQLSAERTFSESSRATPAVLPMSTGPARERIATLLFYGTVLLLAYLLYLLFRPFLTPLAWAAIFAAFFYPPFRRLEARWGKTWAAAIARWPSRSSSSGPSPGRRRRSSKRRRSR